MPTTLKDSFDLSAGEKIFVPADTEHPVRIRSLAATLYYDDASTVSSSSNDGNISSGNSTDFVTGQWVTSTASNRVEVYDLSGVVTAELLNVDSTYANVSAYIGVFDGEGSTAVQIGPTEDYSALKYNVGSNKLVIEGNGDNVQIMGQLAINGATPAAAPDYTVTNPSTDRALNVSGDTTAQVAAVLGTLIADLTAMGILQ